MDEKLSKSADNHVPDDGSSLGADAAHSIHAADQDEASQKSKKLPSWAKFAIGAIFTAILGIVVPSVYSAIKDTVAAPAQPIVAHVSEIVGPGWGVTVPDPQRLAPLVNDIANCNQLHAAAVQAGGADDNGAALTLLVQGNTSSGVTITGMHVRIIRRGAPLSGAYAFCQSAGSEAALPINFNLNQQAPAASGPPKGFGTAPGRSFFANGSVVHLNNGEVFPFKVGATISPGSSVEWVITATVVINGETSDVTIDDNGRPFQTTAPLPMNDYSNLYEYDWAAEDRLLHYSADSRNPNGCAANRALSAMHAQGLNAVAQVLTVDCSSDLAQVELWMPSDRCIVHYLGFHRGSRWTFFASSAVCRGDKSIGALFSRATIAHFGGNPQAFENAFGPYIVSSSAIPANPGPHEQVPQLSVQNLAERADCGSVELYPQYSLDVGAGQVGTCDASGMKFLLLTFSNSLARNDFYADAEGSTSSLASHAVARAELAVIGPTWLVYTGFSSSGSNYIEGMTPTQFAQRVGGEAGEYSFYGTGQLIGNEVPTIANYLL